MPIVTHQPDTLSFFVADITTALATYDRMRFFRSRTGQEGLFEDATAPVAAVASLEGRHVGPHQISGKTLSLMVNGVTRVDVVFGDPDPVTTSQAAVAVAGASMLVTASDDSGLLKINTVATGSGASIEILECDAAPFLGFDIGDAALGLDADLTLVSGTHEYLYTDQNSSQTFWYKTQLLNHTSLQVTEQSPAFQPEPLGTPPSTKIWCYVRLVGFDGNPLVGRRVVLSNPFLPNTVSSGGNLWGVFRHYATMMTDDSGYAQQRVLRGMQLDVTVDGTNFIRRLAIPSTGDSVNLLDPSLVVEDEFGIQQPQIDFMLRTT